MDKQLTADLDVIANSNLEIELLDGDLNIIQKLDDEPNDVGGLSSAQLKAKFDESGNAIKDYINGTLIPAILADDATETARQKAEQGRVTAEQNRVLSETTRVQHEMQRVSAEEKRVAAETSRQEAEKARADENTGIVASATAQANAAAGSARSAQSASEEAMFNASNAADSQAAAAANAAAAAGSAEAAGTAATAAEASKDAAASSASTAVGSVKAARSWAVGGTGTRDGEDTDNAKYWAEHAAAVVGGDFATRSEAQGYVSAHDQDSNAHSDIREALGMKEDAGAAEAAVSAHNEDTEAHQDIRDAINAKKSSYYKTFTSSMWSKPTTATEATLTIPKSEHGLNGGDVFAQISMLLESNLVKGTWACVETYATMASDGTITLHSPSAFSGIALLIV